MSKGIRITSFLFFGGSALIASAPLASAQQIPDTKPQSEIVIPAPAPLTPRDICAKSLVLIDSNTFAPLSRAYCICNLTDDFKSPQYMDFAFAVCPLVHPKLSDFFPSTGRKQSTNE